MTIEEFKAEKAREAEQVRREFGRRAAAGLKHFALGVYLNGAVAGVQDDFGNCVRTDIDLLQVYREVNCFAYSRCGM